MVDWKEDLELRFGPEPRNAVTLMRGMMASVLAGEGPPRSKPRWTVQRNRFHVAVRPWFRLSDNSMLWLCVVSCRMSLTRYVWLRLRAMLRHPTIPRAWVYRVGP